MKPVVFAAFAAILLAAGLGAAAEAQQRVQTQPQRATPAAPAQQGQYAAQEPIAVEQCPIFRVWMAESGLLFHCNGWAMTFDGGSRPGGIAAAHAVLARHRAEEAQAFVRYQPVADNAICQEVDYTRYGGMFEEGRCARVISLGG
ncbi:hypothetical protein DDZ18_03355 [Marinicauda salina]|uniref:Uncharacterized protein n=1 Tax=Marinicauda salina TaxID=2135793 RepID=A0A2U2BXF0_9PROT|nr:hypothetical protein [Marinicauda salina]PWE18649.1 hypothetical protein DDZ18_03355 [Marinicauda salina]